MARLQEQFTQFLERPDISPFTRDKYFYRLRSFVETHSQSPADEITRDMMLNYIQAQTHLSDPSKSILRQCFHAFLSFCGVDPNPAATLPNWRETPHYIHVPNDADVEKCWLTAVEMCKSGHPLHLRNGLIFTLAVVSGNRRGEIRNLTIQNLLISLEHANSNGIHHVYTTGKTVRQTGEVLLRYMAVHVPFIRDYLAIRPETPETAVFVNLNPSHPKYGEKLSLTAFDRIRRDVCKRAGCESITYQELRRRLATKIARTQGVDVAAHALNHSPESGDRVVRLYYYDPDKDAVDRAVSAALNF